MNTYAPAQTLDAITAHAGAVIAIGGLSIVAMFVFFAEGRVNRAPQSTDRAGGRTPQRPDAKTQEVGRGAG
jgi:hypothetical protein